MQHRNLYLLISEIFIELDDDVGGPTQPEGANHDEAHPVARVGEVLGQRGGVLLVVDGHAAVEPALHREDVVVVVHDGDDAGAQYQDSQRGSVRVRRAPVQHADERLLVEVCLLFITE